MSCPYKKLVESFNTRYASKINRYCERFFRLLDLSHFWILKSDEEGGFWSFGTHASWCEYLIEERFHLLYPYCRDPKFFKNEIALFGPGLDEILDHFLDYGKDHFDLEKSIQILEKDQKGFSAFGFTLSNSKKRDVNELLRRVPLLKSFVHSFKQEHRGLFFFLEDYKPNFKELLGSTYFEKPSYLLKEQEKEDFLKELQAKSKTSLTSREKEVLSWMTRGHSASQIATFLHLSRRTVEHHIERMKEKLNCHSKWELLQKKEEIEPFYTF